MFKEFKEFIAKGNVMDMAVGIILGAAFTTIVKSLVGDVMMPAIGFFTNGIDFSQLFITLDGASYETLEAAKEAGAAVISYGVFINAVINFLIVAFVVFLLVKNVNKLKRKEEEAPSTPPKPTKSEELLSEIRDALAKPKAAPKAAAAKKAPAKKAAAKKPAAKKKK